MRIKIREYDLEWKQDLDYVTRLANLMAQNLTRRGYVIDEVGYITDTTGNFYKAYVVYEYESDTLPKLNKNQELLEPFLFHPFPGGIGLKTRVIKKETNWLLWGLLGLGIVGGLGTIIYLGTRK